MEKYTNENIKLKALYRSVIWACTLLCTISVIGALVLVYFIADPSLSAFKYDAPQTETVAVVVEEDPDKIENGIHVRTGFIEAAGMMETIQNCTNCHSSKLVIQNRMNKVRWKSTIEWMQATQNLWDLGPNEDIIIDYLVTNYPPNKKGRRAILTDIEWYTLEE
ncbi:monoheme cytochrome C [Formosa undariae]|uniref:Monoheme cytochrome C n=1 Tax=Formosa undariae TaxID=1325436 RepID=A0ABV5EZ20_9FLAO